MVREVNSVPMLQPISDQSTHFGVPLSITASAHDDDLPANTLTYSLDAAPAGATINPVTGLISWNPAENQVGAHTLTVRVADNGSPVGSASTSFKVTVSGSGSHLDIEQISVLMQITVDADIGNNYELQKSHRSGELGKARPFQPAGRLALPGHRSGFSNKSSSILSLEADSIARQHMEAGNL